MKRKAIVCRGILIGLAVVMASTASHRSPADASNQGGMGQAYVASNAQVGQWDTRTTTIDINGRPHELVLRYFPGDVAWADRVESIAPQAVGALQQAIGVPYPGPGILRVTERTGPEMYGAAGVAQCNENMCALAIGQDSHETVLLHEIAHVWTYAFKNRWLAEGTAESAAVEAAGTLGIPIRYPRGSGNRLPAYPLDLWGSFAGFDDGTLEHELEGYDRSTRLLQLLKGRNPGAMASAYATLVGRPQISVESEQFMDALEDAGGGNNDDLFGAWVFPPEMAPVLAERRATREHLAAVGGRLAAETPELGQDGLKTARGLVGAWEFAQANSELARVSAGIDVYLQIRGRLDAFRESAHAAGLGYPLLFEEGKITLGFESISTMLEAGEQAIAAYAAASDAVGAPRSTIQKAGLLWQDPDGQLRDAEAAFAGARFAQSIEKSQHAQETISGAQGAGQRNIVIGAALLLAAVVAAVFAVRWALSAEALPAPVNE